LKNRTRRKLRSRRGASITFALLLFLVCTVLCSVIITASTASSGRMSQIAETDQRYYAVTSAAELLKDVIAGKTVSVVRVAEETCDTVYSSGVPGTPERVGAPVTTVYLVPDKRAGEISETDLTAGSTVDSAEITTIPMDAAKKWVSGSLPLNDRKLELASSFSADAGMAFDALAVKIEEDLDANGRITLTIYNKYRSKDTQSRAGDRYTMVLTFDAEQRSVTSTKTEDISATSSDSSSYTLRTRTTETTVTTLTWKLSDIKTQA